MRYQMSAVTKAREKFNKCTEKKGVKNCRKEKIAMAKAAKQEASKNSRANAKLAKKTGAKIGSKGFKKAKEQDAAAKKIQEGIRFLKDVFRGSERLLVSQQFRYFVGFFFE